MPIWQFRLILIPERALRLKYHVLPNVIPMELAESFAWWGDSQPPSGFERKISLMLPQMDSWSTAMRMWGLNNADEVYVLYSDDKQNHIEEIAFHIDARSISPGYVRQICMLAKQLGCALLTTEYEILVPDESMILASIETSIAKRFVKDPIATLKSLDQNKFRQE